MRFVPVIKSILNRWFHRIPATENLRDQRFHGEEKVNFLLRFLNAVLAATYVNEYKSIV